MKNVKLHEFPIQNILHAQNNITGNDFNMYCLNFFWLQFTKYGKIESNIEIWELIVENSKWSQDFRVFWNYFSSNKFQRNQWFFLLVDFQQWQNKSKWKEMNFVKRITLDKAWPNWFKSHGCKSPNISCFYGFSRWKKIQTQELMLAFRLACFVTKHKDFLFPTYKGPCRILSKF